MPEENYTKTLNTLKANALFNNSFDKKTKIFDEKKYAAEAAKTMSKEEVSSMLLKSKMRVAAMNKDKNEYQRLSLEYYKDGTSPNFSSDELNSIAWNFFENATDKNSLDKALLWSKQSVKLKAGYANTDTVANLYFKTGDKANAKIWAMKAIELAKKEGEEYQETQELLDKVK